MYKIPFPPKLTYIWKQINVELYIYFFLHLFIWLFSIAFTYLFIVHFGKDGPP